MGWGRSDARFIYYWGSVVWVLMFFVQGVSKSFYMLPTPAKIAYWTALGFFFGAANTAGVIDKQLREEDRRP